MKGVFWSWSKKVIRIRNLDSLDGKQPFRHLPTNHVKNIQRESNPLVLPYMVGKILQDNRWSVHWHKGTTHTTLYKSVPANPLLVVRSKIFWQLESTWKGDNWFLHFTEANVSRVTKENNVGNQVKQLNASNKVILLSRFPSTLFLLKFLLYLLAPQPDDDSTVCSDHRRQFPLSILLSFSSSPNQNEEKTHFLSP